MSKRIAETAKPMMCGEALVNKIIIEPIMPTKEAVPNLPVAHVASRSVKKTAKSQKIGSPNHAKPKGPNVKFRVAHRAQKTPINAMSTVAKYGLPIVKPIYSNTFLKNSNTTLIKTFPNPANSIKTFAIKKQTITTL
jgi:hypothetical protein